MVVMVVMVVMTVAVLMVATAPNPVEFGAATPNCTVSLTSQRHPEKLPEVTGIIRGNPGFPAVT